MKSGTAFDRKQTEGIGAKAGGAVAAHCVSVVAGYSSWALEMR